MQQYSDRNAVVRYCDTLTFIPVESYTLENNVKLYLQDDLSLENEPLLINLSQTIKQILETTYNVAVGDLASGGFLYNLRYEVFLFTENGENKILVKVYPKGTVRGHFFGVKFCNSASIRKQISTLSHTKKIEIVIWFKEH